MLVEIEVAEAVARLERAECRVHDELVPTLQPRLQTNCYREEYAWQHSYERSLMRRARDWIGGQRDQLIGATGLLSEALSNAYVHGNGRDPCLPIIVELLVGNTGYVLSVAHQGRGFDYQQVITRYRRKQPYYRIGGNGLRKLDESPNFRAFFADCGRTLHLWYLDPTHQSPPPNAL